jgi:hypothetical protein
MAFGALVLSEYIAFGNGNDQVHAQVVQPAELKGKRKVGDPLESRPEIHDGRNVKTNNKPKWKCKSRAALGSHV